MVEVVEDMQLLRRFARGVLVQFEEAKKIVEPVAPQTGQDAVVQLHHSASVVEPLDQVDLQVIGDVSSTWLVPWVLYTLTMFTSVSYSSISSSVSLKSICLFFFKFKVEHDRNSKFAARFT